MHFKKLKWVDEITKEHLCDVAVIFDDKVHLTSPERRVRVYPTRRKGLATISILKDKQKQVQYKKGTQPKEIDESVEVSFLFDEVF